MPSARDSASWMPHRGRILPLEAVCFYCLSQFRLCCGCTITACRATLSLSFRSFRKSIAKDERFAIFLVALCAIILSWIFSIWGIHFFNFFMFIDITRTRTTTRTRNDDKPCSFSNTLLSLPASLLQRICLVYGGISTAYTNIVGGAGQGNNRAPWKCTTKVLRFVRKCLAKSIPILPSPRVLLGYWCRPWVTNNNAGALEMLYRGLAINEKDTPQPYE